MKVRVRRSTHEVILEVPDDKLDEVIDAANRHFGSENGTDAGTESRAPESVYSRVAAEKSRLSAKAPRGHQKRNVGV